MVSNIDQLLGCYIFTYRWKQITTDLYVNPTDSYQYVYSSLCHPHHCKKGIPYSQALRRNRICLDPNSFDRRCNESRKEVIRKELQ